MSNEKIIWNFLKQQNFTDAAVAGIMGNLYAESGLSPINLQNTYNKSLGYTDEEYTKAVDSGKYKKLRCWPKVCPHMNNVTSGNRTRANTRYKRCLPLQNLI